MKVIALRSLLAGATTRLGVVVKTGRIGPDTEVHSIQIYRGEHILPASFQKAILIVPPSESEQLNLQQEKGRRLFSLFEKMGISCLIYSRSTVLPAYVRSFAEERNILICSSPFDEFLLAGRLAGLWCEKNEQRIFLPGSLVNVKGAGILITGASGNGKTTLALDLARRGHTWIADDAVEIERRTDSHLYGTSHPLVKHLLEIKGRGIISIEQLLPTSAIGEETRIDMVAVLRRGIRNHSGISRKAIKRILGLRLPLISLPAISAGDCSMRLEEAITCMGQVS